jgi:hypothetical protein
MAALTALSWLGAPAAFAQNTGSERAPVIDVHMHAMDDAPWAQPVCPNQSKFLASDPRDGKEAPFGWSQEDCTPKLYPAKKGEYRKDVLAEMERLNVIGVVFGQPDEVKNGRRPPLGVSSPEPPSRPALARRPQPSSSRCSTSLSRATASR